MKPQIDRRTGLKLVTASTLLTLSNHQPTLAQDAAEIHSDPWRRTHNRVWIGGEFWANPMEDWRVNEGAVECHSLGPDRSVHHLTHQLLKPDQGFMMAIDIESLAKNKSEVSAGYRIGMRSDIEEHRSSCFVSRGVTAGVDAGQLVLGPKRTPMQWNQTSYRFSLVVNAKAAEGKVWVTLKAMATDTKTLLASVTHAFEPSQLVGNVAIVSRYPGDKKGNVNRQGLSNRFRNWQLSGDAFTVTPEHGFGPLLWSMYSLSDSRGSDQFVLKASVLTGPLGESDTDLVQFQVKTGDEWTTLDEAILDKEAWVATVRIPQWAAERRHDYRWEYKEKHRGSDHVTTHHWQGLIRENPSGRPLRMAALTCQNDYAFPYQPVADNVAKLDPDLLFFSGDQIYENHGGFGIIRDPADRAILNYLRKFYQFGWAFREVMRDRPTLCLPDDHDVFQGNLWGEGGEKMIEGDNGASSKGGYREPARMVNVVHKTNVGHHPDPFDKTPSKQDISVYYGDMVYGGVSFAIIADRQWKSGPDRVNTGSGRADHVLDPNFDCNTLDQPGLVLLGDRQEAFLEQWAKDWRGHTLKAVLSQTVFAAVATHHGAYDGYLKGDLDSGSWPQTPRNQAVRILRDSMALHINGDQHLTTLTQYGVDRQRDSNWAFCTPAIAVGYPRWWRPDELKMPHANRPQHGLPETGEYIDSFGNLVYVYAVGNPEVGTAPNRYDKAHQKGSGFGFITFDTERRTYHIESYRFLIDATDNKASNQFPGWPVTIAQAENRGENLIR